MKNRGRSESNAQPGSQEGRRKSAQPLIFTFGGYGIVTGGLAESAAEDCHVGMYFREEGLVNQVIARFADGRIVKGTTADFFPAKDLFHMSVATTPAGAKPVEIHTKDLKALFFVKDFAGDPEHVERNEFSPLHLPVGRRIRIAFKDGEVLLGTTTGYQPGRPGFFLIPADTSSNIERCYIVATATQEITFL